MGMNERRKIKELQDITFPARVEDIKEICGAAIDNLSCHRLNMALRGICRDDLGKAAVRDGLKLIKLKNVKDKAAMKMTMQSGTLEMHCADALKSDGMFSDSEIQKLLEEKL